MTRHSLDCKPTSASAHVGHQPALRVALTDRHLHAGDRSVFEARLIDPMSPYLRSTVLAVCVDELSLAPRARSNSPEPARSRQVERGTVPYHLRNAEKVASDRNWKLATSSSKAQKVTTAAPSRISIGVSNDFVHSTICSSTRSEPTLPGAGNRGSPMRNLGTASPTSP
jgi:hypothetical protein